MADAPGKTLLVFSQVFRPDPASVGQHMTDVAVGMARRGHRVLVYTSRRGYENPSIRYPKREVYEGVEIRRLSFAGFGKKNLLIRAFGTGMFMLQAIFLALFTPRLKGIFFSTSPPLIGFAAALAKIVRRVPIVYWAMDLNPDQLIAMGKIKERSAAARFLEWANRFILRRSDLIYALDRFMAQRLLQRGDLAKKMVIMPPWPHEGHMHTPSDQSTNPFRIQHGLAGKFVFMYSGNHSPANPLKTLLDAAVRLKDRDDVRFVFVGGGLGKKEVEACIAQHQLPNVLSLPYQPIESLGESLSAADIHVVSMGDNMVGIIHPCKIYGAMAIGRPILYLGPRPSHIADILNQQSCGWQVRHGDVDGCLKALEAILATDQTTRAAMGARAHAALQARYSQELLSTRFCDALDALLRGRPFPTGDLLPPASVPPATV